MLTIQPGLANNFNRVPAFGRSELQRYAEDAEYVDYEEITDNDYPDDSFNYEVEKKEAKQELDLWKQTKANVDSITRAADNVPIVKKGTSILSGLTMVAIGWGGLRWGSVGTLEVISKMLDTRAGKAVKTFMRNSGGFVSKKTDSFNKFLKGTDFYKNSVNKLTQWGVLDNPVYKGAVELKDKTAKFMKELNYKRVFVETMGVAGGGTAAVNALGGKAIDGTKQNVEVDEDGNYRVDGEYYHAA